MRLGDRLDGHMVQGHVNGVGRVRGVRGREGEEHHPRDRPRRAPPALRRREGEHRHQRGQDEPDRNRPMTPSPSRSSPTPRSRPSAGGARRVNLEVEVLAKYVERLPTRRRRQERSTSHWRSTVARHEPSDWQFARVEDAIEEIRDGKMVILVDSEDRENEGDLGMAAEIVTPRRSISWPQHGRGLICLALTEERCDELELPPMVRNNERPSGRPSPSRSRPARASPPASPPPIARTPSGSRSIRRRAPHDLVEPGHVFPLRARPGGVLERAGQTEASVDLARLAGCARPA